MIICIVIYIHKLVARYYHKHVAKKTTPTKSQGMPCLSDDVRD